MTRSVILSEARNLRGGGGKGMVPAAGGQGRRNMELTDKDKANIERARKVGNTLGYVLNPDTKRALKIGFLAVSCG